MTAPQWVTKPIGMDAAAEALGISRRTLVDFVKKFPRYELRGQKKVFYPEHVSQLRREIHECACKSNGATDGLMHTVPPQMASGSDALSKLKTIAERRKSGRR